LRYRLGYETTLLFRRSLFQLAIGAALVASVTANAAELSAASAAQHAQASYREYFDLLALPNDAIVPADVRKNVEFLEASFRKRGFTTQQLANDGKPMLFAELPGADAKRKTVLFYMHLDGQPVIPAQWAQKSPWVPVLKRRAARANGKRSIPRRFSAARSTLNGGYSAVHRRMTKRPS
jgi:hypothetical protein